MNQLNLIKKAIPCRLLAHAVALCQLPIGIHRKVGRAALIANIFKGYKMKTFFLELACAFLFACLVGGPFAVYFFTMGA